MADKQFTDISQAPGARQCDVGVRVADPGRTALHVEQRRSHHHTEPPGNGRHPFGIGSTSLGREQWEAREVALGSQPGEITLKPKKNGIDLVVVTGLQATYPTGRPRRGVNATDRRTKRKKVVGEATIAEPATHIAADIEAVEEGRAGSGSGFYGISAATAPATAMA